MSPHERGKNPRKSPKKQGPDKTWLEHQVDLANNRSDTARVTNVELSDEELDGVSGGLIAIIAIAAANERPKYRIGSKHESGTQITDTERDY